MPCSELLRKLVTNIGAEIEHIGTGVPDPCLTCLLEIFGEAVGELEKGGHIVLVFLRGFFFGFVVFGGFVICAAMDARGPTHQVIEKCPLHALPLGLIGVCWAMVVAASLAIFIFRQGGSKKKSNSKTAASKQGAVMQGTFGDGEDREPGTDLDAIIVGAGVAGAALAHTLGKVS